LENDVRVNTSEWSSGKSQTTWLSVVGARPQFVKLAPVCRAIERHNAKREAPYIQHRIIHTGQHYEREIAEVLFEQLELPRPEHNLGVGSFSHGIQLARMLQRMEPLLREEPIDWVIVYGDTNSTLAGALLAARLDIPLAHVEAGCRSGQISMPEEQNRVVADHLSQLLLAPSHAAVENLRREGIGAEDDPRQRHAVFAGDVMHDALLQHLPIAERATDGQMQTLGLTRKGYYLLTLHRAENTNSREQLLSVLSTVSKLDLPVLFPVHPRTRNLLATTRISPNGKIRQVPPLGFLEMISLEKNASKILTDSGGVQKEAFYLGVPCVTLRQSTEWPETVECGANRVVGTEPDAILEGVHKSHPADWSQSIPYGDGKSAEKILAELLAFSNS
jgi:UDP-GlcNAc3NAcA epimerase